MTLNVFVPISSTNGPQRRFCTFNFSMLGSGKNSQREDIFFVSKDGVTIGVTNFIIIIIIIIIVIIIIIIIIIIEIIIIIIMLLVRS